MARCQTIFLASRVPGVKCLLTLVLYLLAAFAALALHASDSSGTREKQGTRFYLTVKAVAVGSEDARHAFAKTALQQLALAHALEAQLAREDLKASGDRKKLLGWSLAVDRYARDLARMIAAIEQGNPASLLFTQEDRVAIQLSGRMVIVSHPRRAQQRALEQEILQEFCTRQACDQFLNASLAQSNLPVTTAPVRPAWTFTEDGHRCSYQGVRLMFRPGGKLRQQRVACAAVIQEIMQLSNEIAWQIRHSVAVSWKEVALFSTPIDGQHRVQLNSAGDSILLSLPVLAQNPQLLQEAALWLRERIELTSEEAVLVLDANDLMLGLQ